MPQVVDLDISSWYETFTFKNKCLAILAGRELALKTKEEIFLRTRTRRLYFR